MTVCQFIPVLCVLDAPHGAPNTHKAGTYIYCALVGTIKDPEIITCLKLCYHLRKLIIESQECVSSNSAVRTGNLTVLNLPDLMGGDMYDG